MEFEEFRELFIKYTRDSLRDMDLQELEMELARTLKANWENKMKWLVLQELIEERKVSSMDKEAAKVIEAYLRRKIVFTEDEAYDIGEKIRKYYATYKLEDLMNDIELCLKQMQYEQIRFDIMMALIRMRNVH